MTGPRRLSQAISEGDGISILVEVVDAAAARTAEEQGAEGIVLIAPAAGIREATALPVVWNGPLDGWAAEADAVVVDVDARAGSPRRGGHEVHALGVECVLRVRDEDDLEHVLEIVDPEILLLSAEDADADQHHLDRLLELLPDVPAGKLAIAELVVARATRSPSSSVRASMPCSSLRATSARSSVTRPRKSELLALAAVLAVAAALRLVGVRYGLPYSFLNPDETSIVPRAWGIVHGNGLDPRWYDYPSLLMYVLAPVQALYDHISFGAARAEMIVIGVAGVAATWWLGRRAYGTGAALVGAATVAVATTMSRTRAPQSPTCP